MPRTRGEFPLTEQSSGGGPGGLNGSVNPETRLPSRAQGTPVAVVISQPAISDKGRGATPGSGLGGSRRIASGPGQEGVRRAARTLRAGHPQPRHPGASLTGRSLCPSQGGGERPRHDPGSRLPGHSLGGSRGRALLSGEGHAHTRPRHDTAGQDGGLREACG